MARTFRKSGRGKFRNKQRGFKGRRKKTKSLSRYYPARGGVRL